ncbi:MAG: exodeoxyribonuclease VII small subunit [Acidobacteriota bacterium]|nr:exodeoxyribonuclease VII small subunit [Acidobacteriota bacterium]
MKDKDLNFEKALADLETTVDKLEKGGLSLNDSLTLFERGVKLAHYLRDELDKAEKKVEILLKDDKGGLRTRAFDPDGGESAASPEAKDGEDEGDEESGEDGDDDDPGESTGRKSKSKPRTGKKPGDDSSLPF